MANKAEPVRFAPEASHIPAWDAMHPLFRQFGSATHQVQTAHGKTYVEIPAVKDAALREIIAALAAYFTGAFIKSHRDMGYIIAECVAQACEELGGTRQAWRAYVTDDLGIPITAQADNDYITLLRVLTGTANDPSRRLGKLAQFIDRWTVIRLEGWGDWPSPQIGDGLPGTAEMTRWAKHIGGWSDIAERHATWLRERDCPRCGTHYTVKGHDTCPTCDRLTHDPTPQDGDIRVIGRWIDLDEGGTPIGSDWKAVHAEHPNAQHWDVERHEPTADEYGWETLADRCNSREDAETEANRLRREHDYSESITEPAEAENRPPQGDRSQNRPQDASQTTAASANSESITETPTAKRKNPNPPKNPPRVDWTDGLKDKKKETVVNLDAAKARREAEEATKKLADLEQKLTGMESDRNFWRSAAEKEAPWREAPDDFAKAAVATDANKAIDAMEALQDALRGTPEWRTYQDELFENSARTANKIKEERDAEKRAELVADPKEQRIARIKNTLVMALRPDTDEHQRNAEFAGVLRMCDGDLAFLDRLSTAPSDTLPPTAQIAEGSPLDWFLKQTSEQFRKHAEEYADRLDELRPQISAFLKALYAVDPRKKEAAENV